MSYKYYYIPFIMTLIFLNSRIELIDSFIVFLLIVSIAGMSVILDKEIMDKFISKKSVNETINEQIENEQIMAECFSSKKAKEHHEAVRQSLEKIKEKVE